MYSKLIIPILLLLTTSLIGQTKVDDFTITPSSLYINKITPQTIDAVSNIEDPKKLKVYIRKVASQSDFDWVCNELKWITNLEVSSSNENIKNIDAVANLVSLKIFKVQSLGNTKASPLDLQPLAKLYELTELSFFSTDVSNTEALCDLTLLEKVNLYGSNVNSISFLYSTPHVRELNLYGMSHTFENYVPVSCLTKLEELNIYMNPLATDEGLAVLKPMTSLKIIQMANDFRVTSFDFLENNSNMEEIGALWCSRITDFSAIPNFKKLKVLSISETKVESLDMLEGITTLTRLQISRTKVTDISMLKNCPDLSSLDINRTLVTDISPLFDCKKLRWIKLSSTIPEEQIEKLKSINPELKVRLDG